ncbi:membrane protein implicated in regulation of membrane protease activity [Halospina denitrificans]|uniref:Membrane protein implicated in regulation of membrane protease activity n=1 Tax=Halospina denitrificans TaxID=332522 RepID=A0A4R7JSQ2_9GAMM|nr:NfeD family protein [Halospina denitrificans]TDT40387.1 membrane protein implicated in regulation of membrane protease activity [Halospina denitrificans]
MAVWQIWLLLAIVLATLELTGAHFIMLAMAASALVVALVTLLGVPSLTAQVLIFMGAALVLTPGFVIWFRRHFQGRQSRTGLVGESGYGERTVEVEKHGHRIGVALEGNWFPARLKNGDSPEPGERVRVIGFKGITAIVATEAEGDQS